MSAAPPPAGASEAAPVEAAADAIAQARRDLFPIAPERWVLLGVIAFLEQCGRGGVGGTLPGFPGGTPPVAGSSGAGSRGDLGTWLEAHLALLATLAAAVVVLVLLVVLLVLWLSSRGTFAYAHCVATGRAELATPWRRHARQADSFFRWRLALAGAVLLALLGLVGVGVAAAWGAGRGGPGPLALTFALVFLVPALVLLVVAASLGSLALRDFVAPLQMATGTSCGPAVRLLGGLVRAHPVAFFLYVVLRIAYGVVQGLVILVAGCLTCCCALVPVVTQTVLQPLFYFERAWPLHVLRRMGYDLFEAPAPPGGAPGAGGIP